MHARTVACFLFATFVAIALTPGMGSATGRGAAPAFFDGNLDPGIQKPGPDSLLLLYAFVCDNGEGRSPCGEGSNCSWYGHCHGPLGNIHVTVIDVGTKTDLRSTMLHGPHRTGTTKFEWDDNEEVVYTNYALLDWRTSTSKDVMIHMWESDPGPGRGNDPIISFRVRRSESTARPLVFETGSGRCCRRRTTVAVQTIGSNALYTSSSAQFGLPMDGGLRVIHGLQPEQSYRIRLRSCFPCATRSSADPFFVLGPSCTATNRDAVHWNGCAIRVNGRCAGDLPRLPVDRGISWRRTTIEPSHEYEIVARSTAQGTIQLLANPQDSPRECRGPVGFGVRLLGRIH